MIRYTIEEHVKIVKIQLKITFLSNSLFFLNFDIENVQ